MSLHNRKVVKVEAIYQIYARLSEFFKFDWNQWDILEDLHTSNFCIDFDRLIYCYTYSKGIVYKSQDFVRKKQNYVLCYQPRPFTKTSPQEMQVFWLRMLEMLKFTNWLQWMHCYKYKGVMLVFFP